MNHRPVRLLTYFPFVRQPDLYTEAEASGSFAVHHDLATVGISQGVIDEVCILVDRMNVFSRERPIAAILGSLESLPHEIRERISLRSAIGLNWKDLPAPRCIAIGKSSECAELVMLRRWFRGRVPVCGIVHSCLFPGVLNSYSNLLVSGQQGDVLCTTSRAATEATKALMEQAAEWLSYGTRSNRATVARAPEIVQTPLAIPDSWLAPLDRQFARTALGYRPEQFIILCFGRISREYKADLTPLLLAFRKLRRQHPASILVIAGSDIHSGAMDSHLWDAIREYELAEDVKVYTNVSPITKKLLFWSSDVFVAPSDNIVESFGLSILEAIGARLPVVASNWSGYRDLVQNGTSGFLIDTAIGEHVWEDASLLAETANYAPRRVPDCPAYCDQY